MALGGPERKTMTVINTNVSALRAQNNSRVAGRMQSQAMERLSSGKRINSAKDDAAGLAIATRMDANVRGLNQAVRRSEEHTSELQSLMRISYAVFCLKKKKKRTSIKLDTRKTVLQKAT